LTNRTCPNKALDETNAAVPSDFADDARIGSNCSPDLEPLSNFGEQFRELGVEFGETVSALVGLDEEKSGMYIYTGFERDGNLVQIQILPFIKLRKA
jgi:hypothetical protein